LPNVGPYIYDVSISGFTRSSIYIYDISSLRVKREHILNVSVSHQQQQPSGSKHYLCILKKNLRSTLKTYRSPVMSQRFSQFVMHERSTYYLSLNWMPVNIVFLQLNTIFPVHHYSLFFFSPRDELMPVTLMVAVPLILFLTHFCYTSSEPPAADVCVS